MQNEFPPVGIGGNSFEYWSEFGDLAPIGIDLIDTADIVLEVTLVAVTEIKLDWNDVSGAEDGYSIERSPDGSTGWAEIHLTGADEITYTNTGLDELTTYYYRVRVKVGTEYGSYSNVDNTMTGIKAPTSLVATTVDEAQIDLSWTDNSSVENGYSVERSPDGVGSWTEIDTVATNGTTYSDTGLDSGTTYYYRVRAFVLPDYSDYSNTASDTTSSTASVDITMAGAIAELESDSAVDVTVLGTIAELDANPSADITLFGSIVELGNESTRISLMGVIAELELMEVTPSVATYFPEPISFKHNHIALPEPVTGYQLDSGGSFWSVVVPKEARNLVATPSFQVIVNEFLSVTGWLTYGRSDQRASRGFHSLRLVPSGFGGFVSYIFHPTQTGYYAFSLDIYLSAGQFVQLSISTDSDTLATATVTATETGWRRYNLVYFEATASGVRHAELYFPPENSNMNPLFTDGWMVLYGKDEHTYFDGDTREDSFSADPYAYGWEGSPHESYSIRSGRNMSGGIIKSFYELDFRTTAIIGLGMGDTEVDIVKMFDGEEILRGNPTGGKEFSIIGSIIGCNVYELQKKRNLLTEFFNTLNSRSGGVTLAYQPVNAIGIPIGKKLWMNAAYLGGLSGKFDNLYQENIELRFRLLNGKVWEEFGNTKVLNLASAPDPDTLIYSQDPRTGQWSDYAVGSNDTIGGDVLTVLVLDTGYIIAGGSFTAIGGVSANQIAIWNPYTRVWSELGGGLDGTVHALAKGRGQYSGYVIVGGDFSQSGDLTALDNIAAFNLSTETWEEIGGGVNDIVTGVEVHPHGQIFIWGAFTQDGSANPLEKVTYYDARVGGDNTWHNLGLTITGEIRRVLVAPDLNIYFCGTFTEISGNLDANAVAYFDLLQEGFVVGLDTLDKGLNAEVTDIVIGSDGYLYAVGAFNFDGNGVAMKKFARYNGAVWEEVGRGEVDVTMYKIVADKRGNFYITMGEYRDNFDPGIFASTLLYGWNGSTWFPPDIRYYHGITTPAGRTVVTPDGRFFLPAKKFGGGDSGTAHLSGYTSVVYEGTASSPVKLQLIGPCVVHRISNWTTNKHIFFRAFELQDGEEFTLDLSGFSPRAFSTLRPDMMSLVLSGASNLSDFHLVPGENHITLLTSGEYGETTNAILSWHNHYWSIDEALQ